MPLVVDPDCLAALNIYAEARGEPFEGQVAVGNVVRNRMAKKYRSDGTVAGTVLAPLQFSWLNASNPYRAKIFQCDSGDPTYQRAVEAWRESAIRSAVADAVLYHAVTVRPSWASTLECVAKIGRHWFYRDNQE
jgi:spore germination cell wall hydrolase CwlJ-like protein